MCATQLGIVRDDYIERGPELAALEQFKRAIAYRWICGIQYEEAVCSDVLMPP